MIAKIQNKIDPARTSFLFLDFQKDVCDKGGGMVNQDAEVLFRFSAARKNAADFLNSLRKLKNQPMT